MRKIDADNRQLQKEHVDGGGSKNDFIGQPYTDQCKGYIKAIQIKKSADYHVNHFFSVFY